MHDMSMQPATESKPTYAMTVMLEEIATLRKRVKELEDDGSGSSDSAESREGANRSSSKSSELATLRKDLMRVENEKADMELDFMNQLSAAAMDYERQIDDLKSQMATSPRPQEEMEKLLVAQEGAMKELKIELASTEEELKDYRQDGVKQIQEFDDTKQTLLEEVTELRLQLENAVRENEEMNQSMLDLEGHYNTKFEEMEDEIAERKVREEQNELEFGIINDCIISLEGQKALLLDEITDLRLQLDRDDKAKSELRQRLVAISEEKGGAQSQGKVVGLEKDVEKLQEELRSVVSAYKTDVIHLEESVSTKDREIEHLKKDVENKKAALSQEKAKTEATPTELKLAKKKIADVMKVVAEKDNEISVLQNQRVSYEQRTSNCIMDHVEEVDSMQETNQYLQNEISILKKQLASEKATVRQLESQPNTATHQLKSPSAAEKPVNAKAKSWRRNTLRSPPPPASPPVSPPLKKSPVRTSGSSARKELGSPSRVRALAAAFESPVRSVTGSETSYSSSVLQNAEPGYDIEYELQQKSEEVKELRNRLDYELKRKSQEIKELQTMMHSGVELNQELKDKLIKKSQLIGELRTEIAALEATKATVENLSRQDYEKKSIQDKREIQRLLSELEQTKQQLDSESQQVQALQEEIKQMTIERMSYEETALNNYDTRVAEARKSCEAELNTVKVQLTRELMEKTRLDTAYKNQIQEYEETIEELNQECDAELEEKQTELDMLKQQLLDQEDDVKRAVAEKEQLCVSMNSTQHQRRDEIDELQGELMSKTAENAQLSRSIQSLQMQVDHQTAHSEELERMKKLVKDMESKPDNSATRSHMHQIELDDLTAENEQLRETVRKTTIEKRAIQEKLNNRVADHGHSSSTSVKVLRDRNEALKKEVEKLSARLKKSVSKPTHVTRIEL